VHLNYQSTFTLQPLAGATGTWSWEAALLPNPINLMWATTHDSVGNTVGNFMNTQITGTGVTDKLLTLFTMAKAWRLTYAGVTCYQDGPDLANQGTIVACQAPVRPALLNPAVYYGTSIAGAHLEVYAESDIPDYTNMQSMPNAYFNKSKEGLYMPLRLEKPLAWSGPQDLTIQSQVLTGPTFDLRWGACPLASSAAYCRFPHANISNAYVTDAGGVPTSGLLAEGIPAMLNGTWGKMAARNVAVTTQFSFFVRMGIEIQVQPGALYTTELKMSPAYDPLAIEQYYQISRNLKDAYPADYNDLGKIWDVISGLAKTLAPALAVVPGVGPALAAGIPAVASVFDAFRGAASSKSGQEERGISSKRQQTVLSSAQLEQVKQAIATRGPTSVLRRAKKKKRKPSKVLVIERQRGGAPLRLGRK